MSEDVRIGPFNPRRSSGTLCSTCGKQKAIVLMELGVSLSGHTLVRLCDTCLWQTWHSADAMLKSLGLPAHQEGAGE